MSFVKFNQVTKRYENVLAVNKVDLSIDEGEFFSLLGPSGCGKTTTLRLIAGFIRPDAGSIEVHGVQIDNVPPEKRGVGMVFQNYALFPHLSVADNIAFGLSVKHVPREQIRERVVEMLELVQLAGMGERLPKQLSGGQQQRVALARVLITRPSVLLLDEPLGALDKQLRSQMQVELHELQRRLGITTIFVTHDQEEAMTLSDRIAVMHTGRIIQVGEPNQVYERPKNRFVSNFLGSSNFFTGRLVEVRDGIAILQVNEEVSLFVHVEKSRQTGSQTTLAVRPEKMRLFSERPEMPNVIPAEVVHLVYMGTSSTYLVQPTFGERLSVFSQNEGEKPRFDVGDHVYLAWESQSCFLLDE